MIDELNDGQLIPGRLRNGVLACTSESVIGTATNTQTHSKNILGILLVMMDALQSPVQLTMQAATCARSARGTALRLPQLPCLPC
jgi:hypothetical protein